MVFLRQDMSENKAVEIDNLQNVVGIRRIDRVAGLQVYSR